MGNMGVVCCLGYGSLLPFSSRTDSSNQTKLDARHPAQLDHHGAQAWRGVWNVTGTTLATAADDGCVRLWKGYEINEIKYDCII